MCLRTDAQEEYSQSKMGDYMQNISDTRNAFGISANSYSIAGREVGKIERTMGDYALVSAGILSGAVLGSICPPLGIVIFVSTVAFAQKNDATIRENQKADFFGKDMQNSFMNKTETLETSAISQIQQIDAILENPSSYNLSSSDITSYQDRRDSLSDIVDRCQNDYKPLLEDASTSGQVPNAEFVSQFVKDFKTLDPSMSSSHIMSEISREVRPEHMQGFCDHIVSKAMEEGYNGTINGINATEGYPEIPFSDKTELVNDIALSFANVRSVDLQQSLSPVMNLAQLGNENLSNSFGTNFDDSRTTDAFTNTLEEITNMFPTAEQIVRVSGERAENSSHNNHSSKPNNDIYSNNNNANQHQWQQEQQFRDQQNSQQFT